MAKCHSTSPSPLHLSTAMSPAPGAADISRGTEKAGKAYSLMHVRNPSSELAARLGVQMQRERGRKGKRKAGGRTEEHREELWDREPENRTLRTREGWGVGQLCGEIAENNRDREREEKIRETGSGRERRKEPAGQNRDKTRDGEKF